MAEEWVKNMSISNDLPQDEISRIKPLVLSIGSFALGVHLLDSDLDIVVVTPDFIKQA